MLCFKKVLSSLDKKMKFVSLFPNSICFFSGAFILLSKIMPSSSIAVILGGTATVDCYDPVKANQIGEGYYVKLEFVMPSYGKRDIVSYRTYDNIYRWNDKAYEPRLTFLNSGQVKIQFVGLPDEGEYICTPQSFYADSDDVKRTVITVYVPPVVKIKIPEDPLVSGSPISRAAECIASDGKPPALVHWKADQLSDFSQEKQNRTTASLTTVSSSLMIKPTKSFNKQELLCEVSHPALPSKNITIVTLNVTYPPDTLKILVDKEQQHLTCVADGNPPPNFVWTLPVGSTPRMQVGPTVTMSNAYDPSHYDDTYVCTASNSIGADKSVNITATEATSHSASQANVDLIIAITVGVIAAIALMTAVYCCMFRRSRRKDELMYSKQTKFVHHNVDSRYSERPYFIQHQNDSLHKNHLRDPVQQPHNNLYEDFDGQYSESGSDYGGDVDIAAPVLPGKNESSRNGSNPGITSSTSLNFRKQRQRPASSHGSYRSKGATPIQPYDEEEDSSSLSSETLSRKYDFPPGDEEEYPLRPSSNYNGYSGKDPRYMDIDDSLKRSSGSEKRKSPDEEPPVVYAKVNKQRNYKNI